MVLISLTFFFLNFLSVMLTISYNILHKCGGWHLLWLLIPFLCAILNLVIATHRISKEKLSKIFVEITMVFSSVITLPAMVLIYLVIVFWLNGWAPI